MATTTETGNGGLCGIAEAARHLGVTSRTVVNLIERGVLRPVRLPNLRRTLIERSELARLIREGRAKPQGTTEGGERP